MATLLFSSIVVIRSLQAKHTYPLVFDFLAGGSGSCLRLQTMFISFSLKGRVAISSFFLTPFFVFH
jgi:hypothetical protein